MTAHKVFWSLMVLNLVNNHNFLEKLRKSERLSIPVFRWIKLSVDWSMENVSQMAGGNTKFRQAPGKA